ncbi:MAG: [protein-PII] uridylyltransferase [Candidatus Tokpelaia sp. JSC189]|nr:MAG: [protein-PII] uridylyltransferase [Candidatus Tokpelaia sp. JSC189]
MNTALRMNNIIDDNALRKTLNHLADTIDITAGINKTDQIIHNNVIAVLKKALKTGKRTCEQMLLTDGAGIFCARRLCYLTDTIIMILHDFAINRIYPLKNSDKEKLVLAAVGGYGRGTLAPGSDIDLMFLLPEKKIERDRHVMEYILYALWDMGLKVGYAARNSSEAINIARKDMSVRTALLEARFLTGNRSLFDIFIQHFETRVMKGTAAEFIHAKMTEWNKRRKKTDETRYLVEPNIKESRGGQRDLQTLFWITKYYYRIQSSEHWLNIGVLSPQEMRIFQKADDFLWVVRCHMHFLAGKEQNRLSFDIQREIAHRLGYTAHPGMKDVERFMKHYFLVAKQVGDLTRIISSALEEEYAKTVPRLNRVLQTFSRSRCKIAGSKDFIVDNHRLNIRSNWIFERDPVNLMRIFYLADKYGLAFHPHAMRQVARSLKLITAKIREDRTTNALFLGILTSPRTPAITLRRMNESGVLGKFIPDFGKIVAMMQFNMYHHYTVDEHLLHCIDHLSRIEKKETSKQHPLAHSLIPTVKARRRELYTALFLHDIAKGRPENHSIAGEKIARRLCPRLGLNTQETDIVAWLVREHLTMNMIAQSRDLNDHKTISDFANIVQTMNRLKLLLILTICDIKGVGPGVWNGWKGQLLRTLYYETELVLSGGFSQIAWTKRLEGAKLTLSEALGNWDKQKRNTYLGLHHSNYWLTVPLEAQLRHAHFITEADANKKMLTIMTRVLEFESVTEITVFAPDHPRLLSMITGACAAADTNIVDAQIFTTTDGHALDIIMINRTFILDEDEKRRARRVEKMIENALAGIRLPEIIRTSHKMLKRVTKIFELPPRIEINNSFSDKFSVIEIKGLDRLGLLSEMTSVISNLSLNIASAHINTYGEKVIDSFYVTDLNGRKITDLQRQRLIRLQLLALFDSQRGRPEEKPHTVLPAD